MEGMSDIRNGIEQRLGVFARLGAKAEMAKRYDAKIVGNELVRSDGRRYQITGRKPSLPNAREMQGEVEWLFVVGNNGAQYNVQRFDDGGYRVFGGSSGMSVQWDGLLRASRPGAKAEMRRMTQQEQSHLRAWIAQNFRTVDEMMEATDKMEKTFESDSEHWESRSWPEVAKAAGVFSRLGTKANMGLTDVQRKAGYKWRVAYTKQLGKDQYLGGSPITIEDELAFATESAARQWADTMLKKGWFKGQGGGPEKVMKATVLMASRPGTKSTHAADGFYGGSEADAVRHMAAYDKTCAECNAEDTKLGDKIAMATDPAVSKKIGKLMDEGYPQNQAIAIALEMKRKGEI